MIKLNYFKMALLSLAIAGCSSSKKEVIDYTAVAFPVGAVKITEGPIKQAQDAELAYLKYLKPDRLLHRFRLYAGLQPKDSVYGGWESAGLSGHTLGHYLTAVSRAYKITGDKNFKDRADYIVSELAECQKAIGTGYVGAIPGQDSVWKQVASGDIRSKGFDLNGLWAPWYTLHKQCAGLIDAYNLCQSPNSDKVLLGFGDWIINNFNQLNDEQFQKMLDCEFGGIAESLADMYIISGDKKYLDMSYRFSHKVINDSLANGVDIFPGRHANTQIPKLIASARQYELTGNKRDSDIATFAWDRIVGYHTYVTGGNSEREYFGDAGKLNDRLSEHTTETCNTYNMLKLTEKLLEWSGDGRYADYIERATYNHILASINDESGMVCYFVPLASGSKKGFSDPENSFTCCVGSALESHMRYNDRIYLMGAKDKSLYVNMYVSSELDFAEREMKVTTVSNYPFDSNIKITVNTPKKQNMTLYLHVSSWANEFLCSVNGKPSEGEIKNGYMSVSREWSDGDVVEISIPLKLYTEPMPDNPNRRAFMFGPLLLVGDMGKEVLKTDQTPVMIGSYDTLEGKVKRISESEFRTNGIGMPADVTLRPFYMVKDDTYVVYFDWFTNSDWEAKKAAIMAEAKRQADIKAATVDFIQFGEMQPERDHNLEGDRTFAGENFGRKNRSTAREGTIFFDMKVDPNSNNYLVCAYHRGDAGRMVDIMIDGTVIESVVLAGDSTTEFFDVVYEIPQDLTKGKNKVQIKFKGKGITHVPSFYGCWVLNKKL